MTTSDRTIRALFTAGAIATLAVGGIAAIRALIFIIDSPIWWFVIIVVAIASGVVQWILDVPRTADSTPDE